MARATGEVTPVRAADASGFDEPALLLAAALRGLFCLHAGAVATPRGVAAFIGRSGAGKSTLAAFLASDRGGAWPLVSDDVLPLEFTGGAPRAVRADVRDALAGRPLSSLPLAAVYVLRRWTRDAVRSRPLPPRETIAALIRHSVATSLFDAPLRAAHLDACVGTARSVPVRELFYRRDLSRLPDVVAFVARELAAA